MSARPSALAVANLRGKVGALSTPAARSLLLLGCAVWAFLAAAPAHGQAPPDVVVLRDGTMFRGTLVERGSERVVIVLPTGEVRTFTSSEVERAGRDASGEPAMVQGPAMSDAAPTIRLHVTSASPGLALEVLESTSQAPDALVLGANGRMVFDHRFEPHFDDSFRRLCVAPCEVSLEAGTHMLGIAQGSQGARRALAPTNFTSDRWLHLEYEDRTGIRILGWVLALLGGSAVGLPLAIGGGVEHWLGWDEGAWIGIGAAAFLVVTVIGGGLAVINDHALIHIDDRPPGARRALEPDEAPEERSPPRDRRTDVLDDY